MSSKPKKLRMLIRKTQSSLNWPVSIIHGGASLEICSDPLSKTHTIFWPAARTDPVTELEHLHELGHAMLCEKIHPMFSTTYIEGDTTTDSRRYPMLPVCCRLVRGWLADADSARMRGSKYRPAR